MQLSTRPGASAVSHPDGNRLAVSFVRQHGKIYPLEGFDESTSWLERLMRRFQRAGTEVVRMVGTPEVARNGFPGHHSGLVARRLPQGPVAPAARQFQMAP